MDRIAVVRSMSTRQGDHGIAAYQMRTGYLPQRGGVLSDAGALAAKEHGDPTADLPPTSASPRPIATTPAAWATAPGFLGPRYAPLMVGENDGGVAASADDALRVHNLGAARQRQRR